MKIEFAPDELTKAVPRAAVDIVLTALHVKTTAWVSDEACVGDYCLSLWDEDMRPTPDEFVADVGKALGFDVTIDTLIVDAARMVAKTRGMLS